MFRYFYRVFVHFSVVFNVLLFGRAYQSFSARQQYLWYLGYPNLKRPIDWFFAFFFNEKEHCLDAFLFWKRIYKAAQEAEQAYCHSSNTETKHWRMTLDS